MLQKKKQKLFEMLEQLDELQVIRSFYPETQEENSRLSGIVRYPAAIVVFDRVDIDEYTNNSNLRTYLFDIWIATLFTRGKEEQQEDEVFSLCETVAAKLKEDPYISIEGIKRIGIFGDVLVYAVEISILDKQ